MKEGKCKLCGGTGVRQLEWSDIKGQRVVRMSRERHEQGAGVVELGFENGLQVCFHGFKGYGGVIRVKTWVKEQGEPR